MIRIATLNINHRTHAKSIPFTFIEALGGLKSDVLVLTEYIEAGGRKNLRKGLSSLGLSHFSVSKTTSYAKGRWYNQVLIASRKPVEPAQFPPSAPEVSGNTNILCCDTFGLHLCGLRAPAYSRACDWNDYWSWLCENVRADIVVGDFNTDPNRNRKRDRVLDRFEQAGGWIRAEAKGEWSYKGHNGTRACLDHALVAGHLAIKRALYVAKPFVPDFILITRPL